MNTSLLSLRHRHPGRAIALGLLLSPLPPATAQTGIWIPTGNMTTPRCWHTATRLSSGRVLVTGGRADEADASCQASAELFEPSTGLWMATGSMSCPRQGHVAVLLPNGKVLVTGGDGPTGGTEGATTSTELYDPDTGQWTLTGSLNVPRVAAAATLITSGPLSGRVLVTAGSTICAGCLPILTSAELYDPATGQWSLTGSMTTGRYFGAAAAASLADGSVLVVGGTTCCPYYWLNETELYDSHSQTWTPTSLKTTAANSCVALMPNGQVLVAGGLTGMQGDAVSVADAELFDTLGKSWSPTASMSTDRDIHTLTVLADGTVLAAGGERGGWGDCHKLSSAEVYHPDSRRWELTGSLQTARGWHTATLLLDGRVLVAGGYARNPNCWGVVLSSAELYIPPTQTNEPPVILVPPGNQNVAVGLPASFSVEAFGTTPLGYQWQFNGLSLKGDDRVTGTETNTLRISAVTPQDAGTYRVMVSNAYGSVTSQPGTLTVLLRPPEITMEPADQIVVSGSPASFTVAATGSLPINFQWRRNGADVVDADRIGGAQTATLSIAGTRIEDLGVYTVLIRNAYGAVTSSPANLTVILQPPELTATPENQSVFSGAPVNFTVTATGSLPMDYRWQHNGMDVADGGRISGAGTATLTIAAAEPDDIGLYLVEVQNLYGWTRSVPAQLTVILAPPTITSQSQGQTVALGSTVTLQVEATGSHPLSYQWLRDGVDLADGGRYSGSRTSTFTISALSPYDLGNYHVIVENALGQVHSEPVLIATFKAVLRIRRAGGQVVVSWNEVGKGMKLQRASRVAAPDWQEVAESQTVTSMTLPIMPSASVFYRLVSDSALLPSGIVSWWPGEGTADDMVGDNHGTLINGATYAEGIAGMAFSFDDTSSAHVSIPSSPSLNVGTDDFSMECWINTSSTKDIGTVQDKRQQGANGYVGYHMFVSCCGFGPSIQLCSGPESSVDCITIESGVFVADGRFHHVAATVRRDAADGIRLFLDGTLVMTGDPRAFVTSSLDNDVDFLLGGHSFDSWRTFMGRIDEFRFYRRALDDQEIRGIYEAGMAGVGTVFH